MIEGKGRDARAAGDEAYDLSRQIANARAMLRECGFWSGDEVRAVVQRVEAEVRAREGA